MAPRRVLVVVENLSVPFDRRVWQECRSLVRAGHHVTVVCPTGPTYDREEHVTLEGVEIHRYPLVPASGGPLGYVREYGLALWRSTRLARRLARAEHFDVVHICNPPDLLFLVAAPLRRRGALLVFDHHDLVPELAMSRFGEARTWLVRAALFLERMTFDRADAVLSTNASYRDVARGRGGVPESRLTVVRSAPDLQHFRPVPPEPALRRGRRHLACYLGVMGPQDGVDHALRSLAVLHHDLGRDDLHTTFIGSGDAHLAAMELATELGLDEHVEFTGRVPNDVVLRVLSTADVALAPDPMNPLNNVSSMNKVAEYLALGVPIVAFDLLETRRGAGEAALYAPPGDHRAFAEAVDRLLDDPVDRARRASLGAQRVREELCWERSEIALLDAYARLTPRAPRRSPLPALRGAMRPRHHLAGAGVA